MTAESDLAALKRIRRNERVDALREGRRNRAKTHDDKKKKANKYACRKGNW